MSVALLTARFTTPGIQKQWSVWSLWVLIKVRTSRDERHPQNEEAQISGAKAPSSAPRRRSRFRRGTRAGRKGARIVKRSKPTTTPRQAEKRPRIEPGSGARARHFVAGFNKSVEASIRVAQQCLDIKRRAEERRQKGQKPFLPPKAASGLLRRQTQLRKRSSFWGIAWGRVFGVSPAEGRRCWRDRLFERSLMVRAEGDIAFDAATSVMNLTDIISKEAGERLYTEQKCICPRCGAVGTREFFSYGRRPVTVWVFCGCRK